MQERKKEEIGKWLRREGIIGDFKDYDCPNSCDGGKLRLVRDASYSKDEYVWKCTNRKCNKKVSVRKGSWFEGSHMTLEQMILFTYMWVWLCEQQFIMRECCIGSCSTIVDWCNFAPVHFINLFINLIYLLNFNLRAFEEAFMEACYYV